MTPNLDVHGKLFEIVGAPSVLCVIAVVCAFVSWAVCRIGARGDLLTYTQPDKERE